MVFEMNEYKCLVLEEIREEDVRVFLRTSLGKYWGIDHSHLLCR
jgi:hypothetical protein